MDGVFWLMIPGSLPSHLPIMWMLPSALEPDREDGDEENDSCVKLKA